MVEPIGHIDSIIRRFLFACGIAKAPNTHSESVIMFFHDSSGYANVLNAAFIRTVHCLSCVKTSATFQFSLVVVFVIFDFVHFLRSEIIFDTWNFRCACFWFFFFSSSSFSSSFSSSSPSPPPSPPPPSLLLLCLLLLLLFIFFFSISIFFFVFFVCCYDIPVWDLTSSWSLRLRYSNVFYEVGSLAPLPTPQHGGQGYPF